MRAAETAMKEMAGAVNDSRLSQRLGLIESRQVRLERDMKHLELHFNGVNEQLALRPLKTDVITAIAQQELAVEACASREAVEKLESLVVASAPASSLAALEETVRTSSTQVRVIGGIRSESGLCAQACAHMNVVTCAAAACDAWCDFVEPQGWGCHEGHVAAAGQGDRGFASAAR